MLYSPCGWNPKKVMEQEVEIRYLPAPCGEKIIVTVPPS